jgi:hypothetical protein
MYESLVLSLVVNPSSKWQKNRICTTAGLVEVDRIGSNHDFMPLLPFRFLEQVQKCTAQVHPVKTLATKLDRKVGGKESGKQYEGELITL